MLATLQQFFTNSVAGTLYFPKVRVIDVIEIAIIAFLLYQVILWLKNTKAWMLIKGILALAVFILFAYVFEMYTILWIV